VQQKFYVYQQECVIIFNPHTGRERSYFIDLSKKNNSCKTSSQLILLISLVVFANIPFYLSISNLLI